MYRCGMQGRCKSEGNAGRGGLAMAKRAWRAWAAMMLASFAGYGFRAAIAWRFAVLHSRAAARARQSQGRCPVDRIDFGTKR